MRCGQALASKQLYWVRLHLLNERNDLGQLGTSSSQLLERSPVPTHIHGLELNNTVHPLSIWCRLE